MPLQISQLQETSLFNTLNPEQCQKIAALAAEKTFAEGKVLIEEASEGQSLYLILEGRVDISLSLPQSTHSEIVAQLKEGDFVGEMVLLGKKRRSARVSAKGILRVAEWDADQVLALFAEDSDLGYRVLREMSNALADRLMTTNQFLRNVLAVPRSFLC